MSRAGRGSGIKGILGVVGSQGKRGLVIVGGLRVVGCQG